MDEISNLVKISKFAGERFDLVQAGGGNSSVKLENGEMLIKASGFLLSDVSYDSGYSRVYTDKIATIVDNNKILEITTKKERENISKKLVQEATIDKINRPSIETLLHSLLLKYTLHTHPIVVNMIVIQKNWQEILKNIFQDDIFIAVEYQTPGIELAVVLDKELKKIPKIPNIIFLQNHGLIITSNNIEDISKLTDYVLKKIEDYLNVDMSKYKLTNKISKLFDMYNNLNISYLSEDIFLNEQVVKNKELFFLTPFCPDSLVYCGISSVEIGTLEDYESILAYKTQYNDFPKVVISENRLFFIAQNIKKAKEIEEVMKFHIMILNQNINIDNNFLNFDELAYLSNWEAEKYRQNA